MWWWIAVLALAVALLVAFAPPIPRRARPWLPPGRVLGRVGRLATVLAIMALVLSPVMAFAQDVPASGGGAGWIDQVLLYVVVVLVASIAWAMHRYLGITLDRAAQDSLHRAMMTGATLAVAQLGVRSAALDASAPALVVDYVRRSVPDALDRLTAPSDVLTKMAAAKLSEVAGTHGPDLAARG